MQISTICSPCKKERLIADPDSGEIICAICGRVVLEKNEETRAEWRTFDGETSTRVRTGIPTSLAQHDMGLSTVIGMSNKDASGNALEAATRYSINRLRTWDYRTQFNSPSERNLRQAFEQLHRLKGKLGLSDAIVEKSAYLYRKAVENRLTRGRMISSILVAAVYIACREMGAARSIRDISAVSGVTRKELAKSYRLLVLELGIRVPLPDPMKCIVRIANKLKISEKAKRHALKKMNYLMKTQLLAGKAPMSFAATVLYISCAKYGESIAQKDMAEASGVTEVTIRNRFKDLKDRHRRHK